MTCKRGIELQIIGCVSRYVFVLIYIRGISNEASENPEFRDVAETCSTRLARANHG